METTYAKMMGNVNVTRLLDLNTPLEEGAAYYNKGDLIGTIKETPFSSLQGKTMKWVTASKSGSQYDEHIEFETEDGGLFVQQHIQSCCEKVRIEDICGDVKDLEGSKILLAEESSSEEKAEGPKWTFYKLVTMKGAVAIRWYAGNDSMYSEKVSLYQVTQVKSNINKTA